VDFLLRLQRCDGQLSSGINRHNDSRTARILDVESSHFTLRFENLGDEYLPQLFLNCELDGRRYFFAATPVRHESRGLVQALLPHAIYQAERRDLERISRMREPSEGARVEIRASNGTIFPGVVADSSYHGLGVLLPAEPQEAPNGHVTLRFLTGSREGEQAHGSVRYRTTGIARKGWIKIGLAVSDVPVGEPVEFEQRERILTLSAVSRITHRASLIRGFVKAASARAARRLGVGDPSIREPQIETYSSAPGEEMRAIIDSWGDPQGAIAVVIPPAWGRTKETLWPLAATIIETFRNAKQPVTVVRFDGTHRRGESFIPPDLRHPGAEYLRFTFSRAVRDIHATLEFLQGSPSLRPNKVVLITFSLAAVEGRRAVAMDPTGLVAGWISVVGMVDLQSALRTISGGIDFAYGLSRGVRFGHHELVGVVSDMDHTGLDALEHRLVFLEDARRDMARIHSPITWIHGRHDAWMDVERVRHLMSCGATKNRRVIEVPTGHQLRTSSEAFAVFGLIAAEVGRMASGRQLTPGIPDMAHVDARRRAERNRLPKTHVKLREFWSRYLLGRDARLGFQLLTATSAYQRFMHEQISELRIQSGNRVLDLGSGTGDFAVQLATEHDSMHVNIDAVDFVPEALDRAAARMAALQSGHRICLNPALLDFDLAPDAPSPFKTATYDAVLASLVISYVSSPHVVLDRVRESLKSHGRLVISTLKRDADISRIHLEGLAELRAGRAEEAFGKEAAGSIDAMARSFLNDASRILDLEEQGTFRFWDLDELAALVRSAGFRVERSFHALGEPPQATVLVAIRD
jgi:ubiquinone/menaquinone biosynthesis C-methylase UbiE/pimeloyl-ACP methyl ester carboxylesterase